MSYFPPYSHSKYRIEIELDLSNYATKFEFSIGVETSQFAKKDDIANLKSEVDELNIDKIAKLDVDELKPVPTVLSKISDVFK